MIKLGEQVRVESPGHARDGAAGELDAIVDFRGRPWLIVKDAAGDRFGVSPDDVVPVSLRRPAVPIGQNDGCNASSDPQAA